ncbi:MAG: hypothetical protein U1F61_09680 [Opitutaceae bacterium]
MGPPRRYSARARARIERFQLPTAPGFAVHYQAYLDKFEDRCLEELKLESLTLHDDPMPLLLSIGQYARRFGSAGAADTGLEKRLRADAEKRVAVALEKKTPAALDLHLELLNHARAQVRDRENHDSNAHACLAACDASSSSWANGSMPRVGWWIRATSST